MNDLAHRQAVAQLLARIAADADVRGLTYGGVIRQGARLLLEVPAASASGCAGCGATLRQPTTGRRRKWCSEACRRRLRR